MSVCKHRPLALAAALLGCAACATFAAPTGAAPASAGSPRPAPSKPSAAQRALLHSHELWATIDVCDPRDEPDTVGIRGSMPGDGHAHDRMYMSFRLQYEAAGGQWLDLSSAAAGWVAVGGGASPRQGGSSFDLKPAQGKPPVTLRGVVDFQWRRGKRVLANAARTTAAGHKSLAGADPKDFSAATCLIG
ncbi:MAG TPA: hypothetical protein VL979_05020 [Solirubrobacteraceae bacterium]|nr:hypothetical protein [Solirubrobacteraceae bacterium]